MVSKLAEDTDSGKTAASSEFIYQVKRINVRRLQDSRLWVDLKMFAVSHEHDQVKRAYRNDETRHWGVPTSLTHCFGSALPLEI